MLGTPIYWYHPNKLHSIIFQIMVIIYQTTKCYTSNSSIDIPNYTMSHSKHWYLCNNLQSISSQILVPYTELHNSCTDTLNYKEPHPKDHKLNIQCCKNMESCKRFLSNANLKSHIYIFCPLTGGKLTIVS